MQLKTTNALPALALNVPDIANKSMAHVERFLGPASSSDTRPGQNTTKNTYNQGAVEVTFKDGRAHGIVIRNLKDLPFEASSLRKLGLPAGKPRKTEGGALKWERLGGIANVIIYPGPHGTVSHAYVSVVPPTRRGVTRTSRAWLTLSSA